ncbi:hypothetical protein PC116_g9323 [Phytophthora cactorum]|uniref:Uncharacterized protein n=1 Tax=Phytophthora cactorum TaxID=29920 RepID=A0A8T1L6E1_9STRA|nr:hypothetical protein PC117_g19325 [Phytophthora cactorum]KAG4242785.1 hypothetical protein PC116_g9323 [Phytophthora cactorum]
MLLNAVFLRAVGMAIHAHSLAVMREVSLSWSFRGASRVPAD